MAYYYYLISSLPVLRTDCALPMSYEKFLQSCKTVVSPSVYEKLEAVSLDSDKGRFFEKWGDFFQAFKKELNRKRRERLGLPFNQMTDANSEIRKCVEDMLGAVNPLLAEKTALDKQFEFLDSLLSDHFFDDYCLFGYALKLKLLERQNLLQKEQGREEFERIFDSIKSKISSI